MKKLFLVLAGVLVLGGTVEAKTRQAVRSTGLPMQTMTMDNAASGPMCPMMDSMPVLVQVLKLQQKLDEGVSAAERKEILEDKAKLIGVLDSAMTGMKGMPCMSQQQMPCAQPSMACPPKKAPACCPQPQMAPPCAPAPKK